jgi:hypothetical protein
MGAWTKHDTLRDFFTKKQCPNTYGDFLPTACFLTGNLEVCRL